MSRTVAAPRGTRDLLPPDGLRWNQLEALARDLSRRYAFDRMETPIFEEIELFDRGLGESSDAVEKEMFRVTGPASGEERSGWALRPEPTAGIIRAYVEHGMHVRPGPLRVWMIGPMFRYDRPQAGRYRQFSQWDVEVVGDPGPIVDAELIELASRYFVEAGIDDVVVHLNTIGDAVCRPAFRSALVDFFAPHRDRLSEDSQRRLSANPLRILDDKQLDAELAARAPRAIDHLCAECRVHFAAVKELLDGLGVRYEVDHQIVRGLDYYTRTTFELYVAGREGQQQALGGGGRYDGLAELLGGRPTPGIGFGLGIDRAAIVADELEVPLPEGPPLVVIVAAESGGAASRLGLAATLRADGLAVRVDGSDRRLGRQLESAAKLGARWAVIVGDELADGSVTLRDLEQGSQRLVRVADVSGSIAAAGA